MNKLFFGFFLIATQLTGHYALQDANGVYLDEKLVDLLSYERGVYIEVGAHNGIFQSNTKLLQELYDWTGILIEPSPVVFPQLKKNRPLDLCFQCALGSFEESGTFGVGDFDGSACSSLNGTRSKRPAQDRVLIRSLQSILDEVNIHYIDLFILDTEGYELNILKGIDFKKTTFKYLLIEIYTHQYDEIVTFLADKGYVLVECFSKYQFSTNPNWDGTHNDYLFKKVL